MQVHLMYHGFVTFETSRIHWDLIPPGIFKMMIHVFGLLEIVYYSSANPLEFLVSSMYN